MRRRVLACELLIQVWVADRKPGRGPSHQLQGPVGTGEPPSKITGVASSSGMQHSNSESKSVQWEDHILRRGRKGEGNREDGKKKQKERKTKNKIPICYAGSKIVSVHKENSLTLSIPLPKDKTPKCCQKKNQIQNIRRGVGGGTETLAIKVRHRVVPESSPSLPQASRAS